MTERFPEKLMIQALPGRESVAYIRADVEATELTSAAVAELVDAYAERRLCPAAADTIAALLGERQADRVAELEGAIKQHRNATLARLRLIDPHRARMMDSDRNLYAILER